MTTEEQTRTTGSVTVLTHPRTRIASPNPTVQMLTEAMSEDVRFVDFLWKPALLGRYDVFHVHWPELVVRERRVWLRRLMPVLVVLLSVRLRLLRTPVVWTVHNITPHESESRLDAWLVRRVVRMVTWRVYMYESGVPADADPGFSVIGRGDYQPIYGARIDAAPPAAASPREFLLFGWLRPYKGIEGLLDVFAPAAPPGSRLVIAGRPMSEEYGEELIARAKPTPSVLVEPRRLSDDELADRLERADVVVLPYRRMYNSGAALLALDFGRPVIVPASDTMLELQAEVGPSWVHTYEGDLDAATLQDLVARIAAAPRGARPAFRDRRWPDVAARYADLYRHLAQRPGDGRQ